MKTSSQSEKHIHFETKDVIVLKRGFSNTIASYFIPTLVREGAAHRFGLVENGIMPRSSLEGSIHVFWDFGTCSKIVDPF